LDACTCHEHAHLRGDALYDHAGDVLRVLLESVEELRTQLGYLGAELRTQLGHLGAELDAELPRLGA
jgi:hypothetical protein